MLEIFHGFRSVGFVMAPYVMERRRFGALPHIQNVSNFLINVTTKKPFRFHPLLSRREKEKEKERNRERKKKKERFF